jgi:DNA-binding XRE family transcriptional regulator
MALIRKKVHYAPSKKRALCGIRNSEVTRSPKNVSCRLCKRWMRHFHIGALSGKVTRRNTNRRRLDTPPISKKKQGLASPSRPGHKTVGAGPPQRYFRRLGRKIRLLRVRRGLTRAQLASSCSLWTGHLGKIERGDHNLTVATLFRIASSLKVTAHALLSC